MKKILYIVLLFVSVSCGNFLEEYSQNASYVNSVDDLDELLLGGAYFPRSTSMSDQLSAFPCSFLHILADESQERVGTDGTVAVGKTPYTFEGAFGLYVWREWPFTYYDGTVYDDNNWDAFYQRISVVNSILEEAEDLEPEDEAEQAQLNRILGECYYLRAWNYFMLSNLYGAAYDARNPEDGRGVTLKLTAKIEDTKFSRASTGEVYRQMAADLTLAAELLEAGEPAPSKIHVSAVAAYALLSRVYLYMEEYEEAVEAADKVTGYALYDLVARYVAGSGESFLTTDNPEVIHAQGSYAMNKVHAGNGYVMTNYEMYQDPVTGGWVFGPVQKAMAFGDSYGVSSQLAGLFNENDARYSAFFARAYEATWLVCRKYRAAINELVPETDPVTGGAIGSETTTGTDFSEFASVRYAEVVLNKAEALACSGSGEATTVMREFLATRYYEMPEIPTEQGALIEFIRQERYKELCFEGHRWFDLRRYAVNTVHPQAVSITHVWHILSERVVTEGGSYTLNPYSETTYGSWILPLPESVLNYCYPNMDNFDRTTGVTQN